MGGPDGEGMFACGLSVWGGGWLSVQAWLSVCLSEEAAQCSVMSVCLRKHFSVQAWPAEEAAQCSGLFVCLSAEAAQCSGLFVCLSDEEAQCSGLSVYSVGFTCK